MLLISCFTWAIIGVFWKPFRNFFHENYSFFDVSFIVAYFSQQFLLILLLEIRPDKTILWVSVFALIVVTTASLQKLAMDSRDRKLKELSEIKNYIMKEMDGYIENLINRNEELTEDNTRLFAYLKERLKKK